ncbi:MAG: hypothetical protein ACYCYN_01185 [Solirubrobacteraceae bacterium]
MLPGASASTKLVGVSKMGFSTDRLDVELTAEDIVGAGNLVGASTVSSS